MNTTNFNTPPGVSTQDAQPGSAKSAVPSHAGADVVQRVAQGAHDSIDRLQSGLQSGVEQARISADEWSGSLRETVREHPLSAVGGAFALGVIFARLMR
mgnify:FL=1